MSHISVNTSWWDLHLRVARGEALTEAERAHYEKNADEVEAPGNLSTMLLPQLAKARKRLAELAQESDVLERRLETLEVEKQNLEALLSESTRNQLVSMG